MNSITGLRDHLVAALRSRVAAQPELREFIDGLEASDFGAIGELVSARSDSPAADHLPLALDNMTAGDTLADTVRMLASRLEWVRILDGAEVDAGLEAGLLAAQAGFAESTATRIGMFLLAPNHYYPPHQHAAHEIYYVLSGTLSLRHGRDGNSFRIGVGELSVTPCNRVHSLETGADPCLLITVWTGDITAPSWWWVQDNDAWYRVRWERRADGRWFTVSREPLTEAVLRQSEEACGAEAAGNTKPGGSI